MSHIHIWMQMLGFNRDDADRGAARFIENAGFTPDSVCALLFHSDFVHLHRGMEQEYGLLQNNCAYYGIPRNKERDRQPWTNYDLRTLVAALKEKGVDFYAGIMGVYTDNIYHREWLTDHPEIRVSGRDEESHLMCLKRFKDGTYYEDWFAEKLVQTLTDYGCAGAYFSDYFCPSSRLFKGDYSTDMVEQFLEHTGIVLSENVNAAMGDDSREALNFRADFIWENHREAWIRFYEWRWAKFFRRVCGAAHAAGKKIWVLGMYCTDPMETRYIYGINCKMLMDAGVDCVTANIVPTGLMMEIPESPYYFNRIHLDLPFLRAQVDGRPVVNFLGTQDASEEWSILDHQPNMLERDAYTENGWRIMRSGLCLPATDGTMICLGDGIDRHGWDFIKSTIDTAASADVQFSWSPMVLWSEEAEERMLDQFIRTRRPSAHRQSYLVSDNGIRLSGCVRADRLEGFRGTLFVPNFDMLTAAEQQQLAAADFPWVATAPADFDAAACGVQETFSCTDAYSDFPMRAFAVNFELSEEQKQNIAAWICVDDGLPSLAQAPERDVDPLRDPLPYRKMNTGFLQSCAEMLKEAVYAVFPVRCNVPVLALHLKNGTDRLYLYNPRLMCYSHAVVKAQSGIQSANVVSRFPVLPVRYLTERGDEAQFDHNKFLFDYNNIPADICSFKVKLAPAGVTIVDVKRR